MHGLPEPSQYGPPGYLQPAVAYKMFSYVGGWMCACECEYSNLYFSVTAFFFTKRVLFKFYVHQHFWALWLWAKKLLSVL